MFRYFDFMSSMYVNVAADEGLVIFTAEMYDRRRLRQGDV